MKFKEFLDYLENNLTGYHTFMRKAFAYQSAKNARRTPKIRWDDARLEKAAYEMWKNSMEILYTRIKQEVKSDFPAAWTEFIEKNNIFDMLNEGISEMDFSEDGAA